MMGSASALPVQARIKDGVARQTAHDPKPSAGSLDARPTERAAALHMIVGGHGLSPFETNSQFAAATPGETAATTDLFHRQQIVVADKFVGAA